MRKMLQPMNASAAEKQTVIDGDGWPIDLLHHAWNSWAVLGIRNIKTGHPVSHVMIDFLLSHRCSPKVIIIPPNQPPVATPSFW